MTSPNLTFVTSGLIWDGVTEYLDDTPEGAGTIFLLRMVGDGSRRYTEWDSTSNPMRDLLRRSTQEDAWETIGVTYEQANLNIFIGHITYLDYDGSISIETRQPNPLPPDLPA